MLFLEGPLNGERVSKREPGRWPTYRDEHGQPVPTAKIEKYRNREFVRATPESAVDLVQCTCRAYLLYELMGTGPRDNEQPGLYRWLDIHNHDEESSNA